MSDYWLEKNNPSSIQSLPSYLSLHCFIRVYPGSYQTLHDGSKLYLVKKERMEREMDKMRLQQKCLRRACLPFQKNSNHNLVSHPTKP